MGSMMAIERGRIDANRGPYKAGIDINKSYEASEFIPPMLSFPISASKH